MSATRPEQATAHPDLARLHGARPSRAADLIAALFDPGLVVIAVVLIIARHACGAWIPALGWTALIVTFVVLLPYAALALLVRRGVVADRHLLRREQRTLPGLIALASVLVMITLLVWLDAPRELIALVLALLAGLVTMSLVTLAYKASLHTGVVSAGVTVLVIVFGAAVAGLAPLVAVVGWSRWRAGRHTAGQVLWGALLGALSAGVVFGSLR